MIQLSIYPGQSKTVAIQNPDGTAYSIPTGSAIASKLVNSCSELIADLSPVIVDAIAGTARITLPDNQLVRDYRFRHSFFDLQVTTPTGGSFYLPLTRLSINFSPSLMAGAIAFPSPSPSNSPSPSPSATPAANNTITLVLVGQDWADQNNKRYLQTLETVNGVPTPKFTEILP